MRASTAGDLDFVKREESMTELVAFTSEDVCRLTGLSMRQLRYWDATDFFSPTIVDDAGRRNFAKLYSFRDVVGLRTLAMLRNTHKLPLQELRRVGAWLLQQYAQPWSTLKLGLNGRRVAFNDPTTGLPTEVNDGRQTVISVAILPIANEVGKEAEKMRRRGQAQVGKLVRNRYVVHNAWVVSGTRVPTTAIWNFHVAGYSPRQIVGEYPRLKIKDVKAAIDFESSRHKAA